MKQIDMSEQAIRLRLAKIDELHALSLEMMRIGREHYRHQEDSDEKRNALARYKKYLIDRDSD